METDNPFQEPSTHSINAPVALDKTDSFTKSSAPSFVICFLTSTYHHPEVLSQEVDALVAEEKVEYEKAAAAEAATASGDAEEAVELNMHVVIKVCLSFELE